MASSSKITHDQEVLYNAENYLSYKEGIESKISEKPLASLVNSKVRKDPITSFVRYYPREKQLLTKFDTEKEIIQEVEQKVEGSEASATKTIKRKVKVPFILPTEEQVKQDPQKHLTYFLDWILKHDDGDISQDDKKHIEKQVTDWTLGEQQIYRIVQKSLKYRKNFVIKPEDTGRLQLESIDNYHLAENDLTAESLIEQWDNFHLDASKGESLSEYLTRLENIITHLAKFQDRHGNFIIKTEMEKRIKYKKGLLQVDKDKYQPMFNVCRLSKLSFEETHSYFINNENITDKQIKNLYGSDNGKGADVAAAISEPIGDEPTHQKEICHNFVNGRCKRGNNCKYDHPKWVRNRGGRGGGYRDYQGRGRYNFFRGRGRGRGGRGRGRGYRNGNWRQINGHFTG